VSSKRRGSDEGANTRKAILDATEAIMRDQGYAAVSSRRIAERAGLKSQLVHYHFGTMDDLFLALVDRLEERHFSRYAKVLTASNSLSALWDLFVDRTGTELLLELTALAGHRKAVRREIARAIERSRDIEVAVVTKALADLGIDHETLPPMVLALFLAGASRTFITERAIGVTKGHAETVAFVEKRLATIATSMSAGRYVPLLSNLAPDNKRVDARDKARVPESRRAKAPRDSQSYGK
jgi:AcrR family transcriptional regulator